MARSTDMVMKFKQKDLCTLLGTQRTTLMATLGRLADEGIIEFESNTLRIIDNYQLLNLLSKK